MLTLENNSLVFRVPQLHDDAVLSVSFMRTLRIPDDGREYPLPAGLGLFPLFHVDDYEGKVPPTWLKRGGVFMPMYQSEALWIAFQRGWSERQYPFAVKIAAGKVNALTGQPWSEGLTAEPQDYLVVPTQPWLDGFCVEKGIIRQFVAMPLGLGVTAEEQLTGEAKHGGLQILAYPMKLDRYQEYRAAQIAEESWSDSREVACCRREESSAIPEMGLAPGGRMRQEIYQDEFGIDAWDQSEPARCFVHLLNSTQFRDVTGAFPPTEPITADQYKKARVPWFDYYDSEAKALEGAPRLATLKSVGEWESDDLPF